MDSPNSDGKGGEPSSLQIDPKCFQDALRMFFQPIKNDDPRLDFYTVYRREATEYDVDYVKKYDEDLNTTLIFAGLFSAVSSAFVIDVYPKLQPDPNDPSVALLRAILLTLNHSAIPNESPVIPPVQGNPPSEIVTATSLLYASLLMSLLAAFTAMLGKQWLNRYLRHAGGSMIERCGDRQRKFDGLQKWPFQLFVESLPLMLQVSLLLLACGLCRYVASINTIVAGVLITLTLLGVLFYVGIVIAGASSYECPFQTPASVPLRSLWTRINACLTPALVPIAIALRSLGKVVQRYASRMIHSPHADTWYHLRSTLEKVQLGILRIGLHFSWPRLNIRHRFHHQRLPIVQDVPHLPSPQKSTPWLTPKELAVIQAKNTSDLRCVSWVLRNITDPEALDAAIRLAGMIQWFEDGINTHPPYDQIISTFRACFGSNRVVYPGSRDRAYYSGRALLWIYALAMCKSEEFARMFPLPGTAYRTLATDHDLTHLLDASGSAESVSSCFRSLLLHDSRHTPQHSQWASNVLLHLSWTTPPPVYSGLIYQYMDFEFKGVILPMDAMLNHFLIYCSFLGLPVEEETLKLQDKSDRFKEVLNQVSRAIISALNTSHRRSHLIRELLASLTRLESHPMWLTHMGYEWCVTVWENRHSYLDWERLLHLSLQIASRDLDLRHLRVYGPTPVIFQRDLVDAIFKSNRSDPIADLLSAFNIHSPPPVDVSTWYIMDHLNNTKAPFSPRLQRVVMLLIQHIDEEGGFREVEMERVVELVNRLHISVDDIELRPTWVQILVKIIESPEGIRHLAVRFWELLVELSTVCPQRLNDDAYNAYVAIFLLEAQEWDKLEHWISIVCMQWVDGDTAEKVERAMTLLFCQRPGAAQNLTQVMERAIWGKDDFRPICERAREAARFDASSNGPPDEGGGESLHSPAATRSKPSAGDRFRESLPLI